MSAMAVIPSGAHAVGPLPDPLEQTLGAVMTAQARLFSATLGVDAEALGHAIKLAHAALAEAERRGGDITRAMAPACDGIVEAEVKRLVRAWPQDKRGDLAGYGAELAILVLEQRPSRRAIETAFRDLKLGQVHLPAIAEVVAAIAATEHRLAAAAATIAGLPARIAKAEAVLASGARRRPARVASEQGAVAEGAMP